jgi:hypothetical protein
VTQSLETITMNLIRQAIAIAFVGAAGMAHAADNAAAKAQYEAEKARCMSGTTGQTQESCLRSAGAAYDEAKAGTLADPNTAFRDNAIARCRALPAADQAACLARVDLGTPRDNVKAGGQVKETVTRETVTVIPAPVQPTAPLLPPPPATR